MDIKLFMKRMLHVVAKFIYKILSACIYQVLKDFLAKKKPQNLELKKEPKHKRKAICLKIVYIFL